MSPEQPSDGVPIGVADDRHVAFSAADVREVEFGEWEEYFKLALDGSVNVSPDTFTRESLGAEPHTGLTFAEAMGIQIIDLASAIADAALMKVRERRAAVDAQKEKP